MLKYKRLEADEAEYPKWKAEMAKREKEIDDLVEYLANRGLTIAEASALFRATERKLGNTPIPSQRTSCSNHDSEGHHG